MGGKRLQLNDILNLKEKNQIRNIYSALYLKKGKKKSFIPMIRLIRLVNLEKILKKMPIDLIGIR